MQLIKPINYWGRSVKLIWSNLLNHGDILYFILFKIYIIYYISRIESNEFDNIYNKIQKNFCWIQFKKIERFHEIIKLVWRKTLIQSFKSLHQKKNIRK